MKGFIVQLSYHDEDNIERFTYDEPEPGHSIFMSLFKDILDDIGRLYWVAPGQGPFNSSYARDENEMEFYYSELVEEYERSLEFDLVSPPYSIFPKYERWIRDNNNTLLGFYNRPEESLLKRITGIRDFQDYLDLVDMFFNNEDASFWECFAKDGHMVEKAFQSALKVTDRKFITLMYSDDRKEFYEEE